MVNHRAHGYRDSVPYMDKGALKERLSSMYPLQIARALAEGMPQMPESDRDPSAFDGFTIERLRGAQGQKGIDP